MISLSSSRALKTIKARTDFIKQPGSTQSLIYMLEKFLLAASRITVISYWLNSNDEVSESAGIRISSPFKSCPLLAVEAAI